jgi:pimeloyl-ACP methyl ester carboxylesterase
VYEAGPRSEPTVVAVHGYPDNAEVWSGVAAALADRFHVVTYDVRGTGDSDKPAATRAYRMPHLLDDLRAVLDAAAPDRPVHLVGHDWGSIQCWPALTDTRFTGRIASYTSISGPALDHGGAWLRDVRAHPAATVRQLAHSYYIALFQLPWLPELAVRRGLMERGLARSGPQPPRRRADQLNGLQLYRANIPGRMRRPRPVPPGLPVQLVVPERDAFVTPALAVGAPRPWVADLTVHRLPAGHWVIVEAPEVVAELIAGFAGRAAASTA